MENKRNWKKEIPTIRKYIEEEGLTYAEVAKIYNTTRKYMSSICFSYSIKYINSRSHKWTEDEINELKNLLNKGLTYSEISEITGKTTTTISSFVIRNNLEYKNTISKIDYDSLKKEKSLIENIKKLVYLGISRREITKRFNLTWTRLDYILKEYNIKYPTIPELISRGVYRGKKTGLTKEVLYNEIVNKGSTNEYISKKYKIPKGTVGKWAKEMKIEHPSVTSFTENKRIILSNYLHRDPTEEEMTKALYFTIDKKFFEDLLNKHNGSIKSSADELKVDSNVIRKAARFYNIKTSKTIKFLDFSKEFYEEKLKEGILLPGIAELTGLSLQIIQKGIKSNFPDLYEQYDLETTSKGEDTTETALTNLNVSFKKRVFLKDVVPKEIRPVGIFVDFIVIYNGIVFWIEYNGKQHYKQYDIFQTFERFKSQVMRDLYESKYCKENKIRFIEIPYTYIKLLEIQDLLRRVIIGGEDINNIIDYTPFYKEIRELGISIDEN